MIDFIKIRIKEERYIEKYRSWRNDRLRFLSITDRLPYSAKYGELDTKESYQYNNITFLFRRNILELRFSLHFIFNEGKHNANDFSISDCIQTLTKVIQDLEIEKEDYKLFKIDNIEFGVNIAPVLPVEKIVSYASYCRYNQFVNDSGLRYSKKAYNVNSKGQDDKYKTIKLYSKSAQYPMYATNVLRFEVKSCQSKYFNSLGIYHIGDLLNESLYNGITGVLLAEWSNVLLCYLPEDLSRLTAKEERQINKLSNPNYWFELIENKKESGAKGRVKMNRAKELYFKILDRLDDNLHTEILNNISSKISDLKRQKCYVFHNLQKDKNVTFSTVYKGGIRNKPICKYSGLPLAEKDISTGYARTATFEELKKENPEKFEYIKSIYYATAQKGKVISMTDIEYLTKRVRIQDTNTHKCRKVGYHVPKSNVQMSIPFR